ncbi:cysteine proteinase [Aureobasidium pullulans]|uniref:Ubiquitin carboxyl-terminal hydrolase n=1 Tax=Aureobasidium pullulans TaxID=5580 RepID=A0A4S9LSX5_AURPU|nr:cysteine proteinase [Aureobasidium pullulans]
MAERSYSKCFTPLESGPDIFTTLGHQLGLADHVVFRELFSLDKPCDGKVLAYTLAFPTTPAYDAERAAEELQADTMSDQSDIVFLKQTIHNACGLYALLHAACNGHAKDFIKSGSVLQRLVETSASERSSFLDESRELELLYAPAANDGYTAPPSDLEADVEWHYTCFAPSLTLCKLYEFDGDRRGPFERTHIADDLSDFDSKAISLIRQYFENETGQKAHQFNVMALVDVS